MPSIEAVNTILNFDVNLEHRDNEGRTALHIAATGGFADVVTALIAKGAATNVLDKENKTPLMYACEGNHTSVIHSFSPSHSDVSTICFDSGNLNLEKMEL